MFVKLLTHYQVESPCWCHEVMQSHSMTSPSTTHSGVWFWPLLSSSLGVNLSRILWQDVCLHSKRASSSDCSCVLLSCLYMSAVIKFSSLCCCRLVQLSSLPAEIGQLSRLRVLFIYRNNLTEVPEELGACTQLEVEYQKRFVCFLFINEWSLSILHFTTPSRYQRDLH